MAIRFRVAVVSVNAWLIVKTAVVGVVPPFVSRPPVLTKMVSAGM
jgi:hypothetical protein